MLLDDIRIRYIVHAKLGHLVHVAIGERTTTTGSPSSYHRDYANALSLCKCTGAPKIQNTIRCRRCRRSLTWDVDGLTVLCIYIISRNIYIRHVCLSSNLHHKKGCFFFLLLPPNAFYFSYSTLHTIQSLIVFIAWCIFTFFAALFYETLGLYFSNSQRARNCNIFPLAKSHDCILIITKKLSTTV